MRLIEKDIFIHQQDPAVAIFPGPLTLEPSKPVYLHVKRLGEHWMDARFPIYWGG